MLSNGIKVFVVSDPSISRLFKSQGYEVTEDIKGAQIVAFPGGNDVHWSYYQEKPTPGVHYWLDEKQDEWEVECYHRTSKNQLKVGFCKGLQLLHVMAGGKLIPDIHHTVDSHIVTDLYGESFRTNTLHHQAVLVHPGMKVQVLGRTQDNIIEAAYYPDIHAFGTQFHPENYMPPKESIDWTFKQIARLLHVK